MEKLHLKIFFKYVYLRQQNMFIVLFFVLLFFGLFLGDGKQGVIEVFGVTAVMVLFGSYYFTYRVVQPLPRPILFAWATLAVAGLCSTIVSSSVGFSLSWLVRFTCAYLVCTLFYGFRDEDKQKKYIVAFLCFLLFSSISAMLMKLLPTAWGILPSMNLLRLNYGHNHLADLLVFAGPLILFVMYSLHVTTAVRVLVFSLYCLSLVSTNAIGSWGITGAYFIYELSRMVKPKQRKNILMIIGLTILMTVSAALVVPNNGRLKKFIQTKEQSGASRLEYWRQASVGLLERPLFGNGPGTFSLVSTRLRQPGGAYSWFAHSLPLQTMSDIGIVGFLAFLWLIIVNIRQIYVSHPRAVLAGNTPTHFLCWGILLVFVYSFVEFTLDYFIVWLLFWSAIGVLIKPVSSSNRSSHSYVIIPLAFLIIFYFLWVIGAGASILSGRYDASFYIAPFDATNALAMLSNTKNKTISNNDINVLVLFHKQNSSILNAIAKNTAQTNPDRSISFFKKSVAADPQNTRSYTEYIDILLQNPNKGYLANALTKTGTEGINFSSSTLFPLLTATLFDEVGRPMVMSEYKAKLCYFLGLRLLSNTPEEARLLWTLARDLAPGWGHFHVELASLYYHVFHDEIGAKQTISMCLSYPSSKKQCELTMWPPPQPGQLYEQIQAIPTVL